MSLPQCIQHKFSWKIYITMYVSHHIATCKITLVGTVKLMKKLTNVLIVIHQRFACQNLLNLNSSKFSTIRVFYVPCGLCIWVSIYAWDKSVMTMYPIFVTVYSVQNLDYSIINYHTHTANVPLFIFLYLTYVNYSIHSIQV